VSVRARPCVCVCVCVYTKSMLKYTCYVYFGTPYHELSEKGVEIYELVCSDTLLTWF